MAATPGHPLAAFDHEVESFMTARGIPGAALGIARHGRLIYARGYGLADREQSVPAAGTTLFRLASLSKPITALSILRLAAAGRLSLDEPAFDRLGLAPLPGRQKDERLAKITVRHLLQHTGGWDAARSGDPMFMAVPIARQCGVHSPPGPRDIIRHMLGRPLDFEPGSRMAYSNFGYCVLGRIIESVTGHRYGDWVQRDLLRPAGVRAMRLGASLLGGAAPAEARYYLADDRQAPSVFDNQPGLVPAPYGSFALEAMDAHGGWLGSVVDLLRLSAALLREKAPLLPPPWFAQMTAPPPPPVARLPDGRLAETYYGCGWMVRPTTNPTGFNLWHNGSLPGSFAFWAILSNGLSWVALFNQRREAPGLPDTDIDAALHRAAAKVTRWPEEDLFEKFS